MSRLSHRGVLSGLCLLALFLLCFRFDGAAAGYDIDPSWSAVMSWGWLSGARWGSDLVFSYGPFSFLSPHTSFSSDIFAWAVIGQLLYAAAFATVAFLALRSARLTIILVALAWLLVYGDWLAGDVCWLLGYPLALLALRQRAGSEPRRAVWTAIFTGLIVAVPCVVKFSLVPAWPVWAVCVLGLRIPMRLRMLSTGASATGVLLLWMASGNSIVDFARYLETGMEITAGYGSAMQRPPRHWSGDVFGLVLLIVTLSVIVGNALIGRGERRETWAWSILLCTVTLLAFKAGYTRVDAIHVMIFLPVACGMAALAAAWPGYERHRASTFGMLAVFLIAAVALWSSKDIGDTVKTGSISGAASVERLIENGTSVVRIGDLRQRKLDEQRELDGQLDFPLTRDRIGTESVDIVPVGQGLLFRNRLNYQPRPVFQSYFSYTPELARRNTEAWRSDHSPAWVLLNLSAIDQRLPTSEDGASLLEILGRYRLAGEEKGILLFQRAAQPSPYPEQPGLQPPTESSGLFEQPIAVPSGEQATSMALTIRSTLAGRIAASILREPRIFISVTPMEGEARMFRLVRGSAETPFLISPLVTNNAELAQWLAGGQASATRSVTLFAESAFGMPAFEDSYTLRWGEFQPLR